MNCNINWEPVIGSIFGGLIVISIQVLVYFIQDVKRKYSKRNKHNKH